MTARMLREKGACSDQVDIFAAEWPKGGRVTRHALIRAAELHLNLDWFASTFLPAPAWAAFKQAKATASAAFDRAKATASAAFDKRAAFNRLAAFKKSMAPAWAAYDRATATALADALGLD